MGRIRTILVSVGRQMAALLPKKPVHEPDDTEDLSESSDPFPEPVVVPFADVLDLHSIPPRQVPAVVEDYLEEAKLRGVRWLRIIHGKGIGVQRQIVRDLLLRSRYVLEFRDAPPDAGGLGATIVVLVPPDPSQVNAAGR